MGYKGFCICERLMMIMKGIYYPCRKLEAEIEAVSELFQKIFNDYLMTIQLENAYVFLTCNLIWPLIMLVPFIEILVGQNVFHSLVK